MKKIRVLVFPCGSENAGEIHQALRYSVHVELHGASSADDHGRFRFSRYHAGLPRIDHPDFDEAFGSLLRTLGIDMVYATHDSVMEYLAQRAAGLDVYLVNGDPRTVEVARRKSETYRLFADCDWAPRVYASADAVTAWPAVVKPDQGQGGQGVAVAVDRQQLGLFAAGVQEPVYMEHLPGDELTVDCFTDANRELVWIGPRSRERVRAGISMRSRRIEPDAALRGIASDINARLALRGPWFFQVKQDRAGRWKLLELSCRVAGTMVAQRAWGVNLPLMAVQDYLGRKLRTLPNPAVTLVDRSIVTRAQLAVEYHTVFVDLDDTLIIDGAAVGTVLAFLYQAVADGKRLVLITRHAYDVVQTLADARIAPNLFDEIIHLRAGESKAGFVTPGSIFIDNHFPERWDVATATSVPVLDVDALEFFLR